MTKLKFSLISLLFFYHAAAAQDQSKINQILNSLNYSAELPEGILQTKSLVIVKTPPKSTAPRIRGSWKALSEKAQAGFKKAGIDVVAYYHIEDIYSGKDAFTSFLEDFKKREFENVVFLVQRNDTYRIVLTKTADKDHLVLPGEQAWQTQHSNLAVALDNLYKTAANSSQERKNFLILEVPEFGNLTSVIKGRRGEYYDVNFSSLKLAVPIFADTADLNAVMANYPFKYSLTAPDMEDQEMRTNGYQFALYYVHSAGKAVKEMLDYTTTDTETAYISEVSKNGKIQIKSYNVNTPVYKFYIKHIRSGNVFLGKYWDAAPSWEEALANYINNIRASMLNK